MLNIGFAGFLYNNADVIGNADIKYQAYFYKVNPSSSLSKWNTVKTIDGSGYYTLNLGDGDWLTQSGVASTGDKVIIVFWKPVSSGRTDLTLTEWGAIEITLTASASYLKDVQIKANQVPIITSWILPIEGRVNVSVTATNNSTDDHVWTSHGTTTYQWGSRYGVPITPISSVKESKFEWDDGHEDIYPGSGNGSHAWTAIGDFDVVLTIKDYNDSTATDTKPIRIKYRLPVCGAYWLPINPTIENVTTIYPNITDMDLRVTGVDWYIDGDLKYAGVSKIFNFTYQFPTNDNHIIKQVLHFNDGFGNGIIEQEFTVIMTNLIPIVDIEKEYESAHAMLYNFIADVSDPDGTIVNYKWQLYRMPGLILIFEKEGATLDEIEYLFNEDLNYRMVLTCRDDSGEEGTGHIDFIVEVVPISNVFGNAFVAKVELNPALNIVVKKK